MFSQTKWELETSEDIMFHNIMMSCDSLYELVWPG